MQNCGEGNKFSSAEDNEQNVILLIVLL